MITKKTLKLSLKSLKDFAKKRLPDEVLRDLDARDECPLEIVRHMCSPDKLGIQLLFIPEEFGGMGGGAFDVYCVCEEMARIDLGVATAVLATFLGSDPITVGATPEQKKLWLTPHCGRGIVVRLWRHRAGRRQRSGSASQPPRSRSSRTAASPVTRSMAASNGSATAGSPMPTRFWRTRPPVRVGSSSKKARRVSPTTSRKTSTASASATPQLSRSTTFTSMPTGCIGGVEGQGLNQAQAVFGYTRLMVAAFGLGGRLGRARSGDSLFHQAHSGRSAALGKAGIHAQADRAERGAPGSRARLHRRNRGAHRRRRRQLEHRRRHRQVHGDRSRRMWPPTPASRRWAATVTRTNTWWRRSGATFASPRFTKAPPRSWR